MRRRELGVLGANRFFVTGELLDVALDFAHRAPLEIVEVAIGELVDDPEVGYGAVGHGAVEGFLDSPPARGARNGPCGASARRC